MDIPIFVFIIAGVFVFLVALYFFLIAPKKTKDMEKYKNVMYAHRGLHNEDRAENSMSAFRAAVEAGYGIELDVRLSKDGKLVVFHDDTLDRVCGREGKAIDFTAEELSTFKLCGTEDGIPLFSDVLRMINGRIPLLVEIKEDAGDKAVSTATCEMMKKYKGDYIIESFNPMSLANVKKLLPSVSRGILCQKYMELEQYRKPLFYILQLMLTNLMCRPAFIAFNHEHANALSLKVSRAVFGVPTVAWTVRSSDEEALARKNGFDGIIFESYIPKNN